MPIGALAALGLLVVTSGCGFRHDREAERRRIENDRNSAAFKAGQAAHKVAQQAEKAAAVAGRKLGEAARKASEGWKEDQRQKEK